MHEDMLFYWGKCVTHWEIQVSGELVSFRKLGQFDLYLYIYIALSSLGLPMSTICPMEPAGVGFVPGPPENGMHLNWVNMTYLKHWKQNYVIMT